MGYTQSGKVKFTYLVKSVNIKEEYIYDMPMEYFGLALLKVSGNNPHYEIYGTKLSEKAPLQQSINITQKEYKNEQLIHTYRDKKYLNQPSGGQKYYTLTIASGIIGDDRYTDFELQSELPIFSDVDALETYLKTGDDSGKLKFLNTDWKLYIDGKSNPLYKLTWN